MASTASDISSNMFRVLKTIKQTSSVRPATAVANGINSLSQIQITGFPAVNMAPHSVSYVDIVSTIIREEGLLSLFTRGLNSRILSNGLQSVLFTIG